MPLANQQSEKDLTVINRKIFEIKKKIQLSEASYWIQILAEGQRKAHYEECDAEKKKNTEKMRQLKKEIKDLHLQLGKPGKCDEATLRASNKSWKEINVLMNKRSEEVVVILGDKIVDKKKKLDLLRHQSRKLQNKMKKFADEYQELQVKNAAKQGTRNTESSGNQRICSLENQIHRVDMNMMEAEHVKKKYRSIRGNLLDDSVEFESSLEKIEQLIQKQEKEILHLQEINKEALDLRDMTKGTLMRQEVMALNAGKARDRQLVEFRSRVEERKQELERLERLIFPSARALIHQDSASSSEVTHSQAEETASAKATAYLESAFGKLKEATGETETEEVLQRFLSQKETMSRLTYLKNITEKEKRELEMRKDFMMAELEAFKFAEVKDKEENMEEVEKMKHQVEENASKKEMYEEQKKKVTDQLVDIIRILYVICKKLEDMDNTPVPPQTEGPEAADDLIKLLEQKIRSMLKCISIHQEEEEEEEDQQLKARMEAYTTPGKGVLDDAWMFPAAHAKPAAEGKGGTILPVSETDDEEDVPTRGYLKRQAQIIVDAKSRRKQFNFNRGRK